MGAVYYGLRGDDLLRTALPGGSLPPTEDPRGVCPL